MTYRNLTLVSKVGNGMATRARNLSSLITREGIHEGESCSLWKYLMQARRQTGERKKGQAFIVELSTSHRDCRLLSRHYVPTHTANQLLVRYDVVIAERKSTSCTHGVYRMRGKLLLHFLLIKVCSICHRYRIPATKFCGMAEISQLSFSTKVTIAYSRLEVSRTELPVLLLYTYLYLNLLRRADLVKMR